MWTATGRSRPSTRSSPSRGRRAMRRWRRLTPTGWRRRKARGRPASSLVGTEVLELRANRGKIEAQGKNPPVNKSRTWSQDYPPTRADGLFWLDQVWNSLTASEKRERLRAYEDAKRFIENAPAGGYGPLSRTFQDPQRRDPHARIDVVIFTGSAFGDLLVRHRVVKERLKSGD